MHVIDISKGFLEILYLGFWFISSYSINPTTSMLDLVLMKILRILCLQIDPIKSPQLCLEDGIKSQ